MTMSVMSPPPIYIAITSFPRICHRRGRSIAPAPPSAPCEGAATEQDEQYENDYEQFHFKVASLHISVRVPVCP